MSIYDLEKKRIQVDFVRAGFSAKNWKRGSESAKCIVKSLGFDGPEDVRRVADKYGRRA